MLACGKCENFRMFTKHCLDSVLTLLNREMPSILQVYLEPHQSLLESNSQYPFGDKHLITGRSNSKIVSTQHFRCIGCFY